MKASSKTADRLAQAEKELSEATAGLKAIEAREDEASASPKAYADWQADTAAAQNEARRLEVLVKKLRQDLEAENQAAAAAAQVALEAEADREAEAVGVRIADFLRTFGPEARSLLRAIATSDIKVKRANDGRKVGAPPIRGAEERARTLSGPDIILNSRIVSRWCYAETGAVLDASTAERVVANEGAERGVLPARGWDINGGKPVVRRQFREITRQPARTGRAMPDPLAKQLAIPSLMEGEAPYWSAPQHSDDPEFVLEHLDQLETPGKEFQPVVQLIPVQDEIGFTSGEDAA